MATAAPATSNVATFRFSTDDFSERERLTAWREIFGRTVCNLDIEPLAADHFRSDSTIYARPGLGILAGSCSAVHLSHPKNLIVDDDLSFMTGSMPKWTAFQHDRNPVLGPGDGVLMNNAEVGSMLLPDTAAFITFKVPVKAIAPLVPDIGALIARRVPHDSQPLRLLVRYLGALQEEGALQSAELQRLAVTHVYDLFALALGATREAAEIANGRGLRAARLRAIKTDLAASLGRPELSINTIAARHGITPRYVQKLFETEGTTFSEFLLGQRLALAYRMLTDSRFAGRTVGSIALEVGFNDLSYFHRTFRRRFGATPGDVRAAIRT
jgi:AraC-like DNA-binding protein